MTLKDNNMIRYTLLAALLAAPLLAQAGDTTLARGNTYNFITRMPTGLGPGLSLDHVKADDKDSRGEKPSFSAAGVMFGLPVPTLLRLDVGHHGWRTLEPAENGGRGSGLPYRTGEARRPPPRYQAGRWPVRGRVGSVLSRVAFARPGPASAGLLHSAVRRAPKAAIIRA